jgi:tetratricopeptide (TPR) repeat protein
LLNQFSEAEKALHAALQQPGDEKDPFYLRSLADTYNQLSLLWMLSGWPVKSQHNAQEAQKYYEAIRDPYGKVGMCNTMAIANYFSGNYQSGRQYCEVGIELAEKIQAWKYLGNIYGHAAKIDIATGKIDSALSNARQAIQIGNEWGHTELVAIGKYIIGNIFLWFLDPQQASKYYQAGYDINQNPFLTNNLLFRVGLAQSLTGNIETGLKTLDQVIQTTTLQHEGLDALQSRLSKAWILYEKERFEGLAEMAAEMAEEARLRGLKFIQVSSEMIIHLLNIRSNGAKAEYRALE